GTGALEAARAGFNVQGVVSIHGGLSKDASRPNKPIQTKVLVELLRPSFGRYSGIMADMYYDYLLASDFDRYGNGRSLDQFARNFYWSVLLYYWWLPKKVKGFIFHFIKTNRLKKYGTLAGLQQSLEIMSVHKSSAINPTLGIEFLAANESQLRNHFDQFMMAALQKFPLRR
ncbi:MAG: acyl carrier protein phosphodiesterase, partial [Proteiniphilum sp.]|nr:acyl carrier protein phosphodiesterase [Proteiniphilum sp.]